MRCAADRTRFVEQFYDRLQLRGPPWRSFKPGSAKAVRQGVTQPSCRGGRPTARQQIPSPTASAACASSAPWTGSIYVESLSIVEQTLREDPSGMHASQDFAPVTATGTSSRLARRSTCSEMAVAREAMCSPWRLPRNEGSMTVARMSLLPDRSGTAAPERAVRLPAALKTRIIRAGGMSALPLLSRPHPGAHAAGDSGRAVCAWWVRSGLTGGSGFLRRCSSSPPRRWRPLVNLVGHARPAAPFVATHDFPRDSGQPPHHGDRPHPAGEPARRRRSARSHEIAYLGNRDPNLFFCPADGFSRRTEQTQPDDEALLAHARAAVEALNATYLEDRRASLSVSPAAAVESFERVWMGYERKRGKLEQFNARLRARRKRPSRISSAISPSSLRSSTSSPWIPTRSCRATRHAPWSATWRIRSNRRSTMPPRAALSKLRDPATARLDQPDSAGQSRFTKLFAVTRGSTLHARGLGCLPGTYSGRLVHRQGHLRRGRVSSGRRRTL